ncbi:MAG: hypothetical protein M9924_09670 [Rhizobiaceae bacterium]|nr:hypothetical protein [Rhizobiaceae bacterium]
MFAFINRPIAALARAAHHMRKRHEQIRAQRVLDSLPEYLRKDIGWPDREFERETRIPARKSKVWDAEAMLARTGYPST